MIWLLRLAVLIALAAILRDLSIVTMMLALALTIGGEALLRGVRAGRIDTAFPLRVLRFHLDFAWDLVVSNVVLAWDVLTPKDYHTVAVIRVPIDDLSEGEVALLSHRITLTPGTLACDVDPERKVLFVHAMYPKKENPEAALRYPIDLLKGTRGAAS